MIEYLLLSVYDGCQYGLFSSVDDALKRANDVFKHSRFHYRRRFWDVVKFVDKHLVDRFSYLCPHEKSY